MQQCDIKVFHLRKHRALHMIMGHVGEIIKICVSFFYHLGSCGYGFIQREKTLHDSVLISHLSRTARPQREV